MLTLKADLQQDAKLGIATLIHGVVRDLLQQHQYAYAHFPEFVDLAVIGTGLGVLQSNFDFVSKTGSFWDTTQWRVIPRPFLDSKCVAYANAVAAWTRDEKDSLWIEGLEPELKRAMLKSLKFLQKTDDSFFQPKTAATNLLKQSQRDWLKVAASKSATKQVVAVRHLRQDETVAAEQQAVLVEKLRSTNDAVMINAIAACEQVSVAGDGVVEELRFLTQHRDNVVRAKAMCALSRLDKMDEPTLQTAGDMLGSKARHEIFAGLMALSSQGSISGHLIPAINKSFIRNLQVCDYEFINLFAAAFSRWLDDPKSHVEQLVREQGGPEYMDIAMEAIDNVDEQMIGLGS